jgi:hypothetical protein
MVQGMGSGSGVGEGVKVGSGILSVAASVNAAVSVAGGRVAVAALPQPVASIEKMQNMAMIEREILFIVLLSFDCDYV